jgi:DNA-binding NarL/FixJ family response regulator
MNESMDITANGSANKISVLIIEDDALLRSGLEMVIRAEDGLRVSGTARDGLEALRQIECERPDLVLLDLQMPDMDGITFIRKVRKQDAELPILILTTFNEEDYIIQGLAHGANGYLLKGLDFAKLIQAIRDTYRGQYVLPAEVAAKVVEIIRKVPSYTNERGLDRYFCKADRFTLAEQKIIRLLLNRRSNKEIAAEMFLTEGTIKNKLTLIYEKLDVGSRQDAIRKLESLADMPDV